jgi:hypothetical protein
MQDLQNLLDSEDRMNARDPCGEGREVFDERMHKTFFLVVQKEPVSKYTSSFCEGASTKDNGSV